MTSGGGAPPRLARFLLSWATPERYRQSAVGDLEEAFLRKAAKMGLARARRWYWSQALRSVVPAIGLRFRGPAHMNWAEEWTMGSWLRHMRVATRSLARKPGFAFLAIITLGLGIGANTAIFSVIYGSVLRPLPYADVGGLVYLSDGHDNFGGAGVDQSLPNLLDLREGSRLLGPSAIINYATGNLSTDEEPERVSVLEASSELLGVLGVAPHLGRDLLPGDDVAGSERVALITNGLWRRRFGGDPGIVGRTTIIDAAPVRIVGVTPADFYFPGDPEVFVTLQHVGAELSRGSRTYNAVGRLEADATVEALREELQGIFTGLVEQYPDQNGDGWYTWADPIETWALGRNSQSLYILGGAVLMVLLIACVNVANLLLVRAEVRQRELAVRFALGAGRGGLIPHFLAEGLVLSLLGGAAGILAAVGGMRLLVILYGGTLPRTDAIGLNGTVLVFSLAVSLMVGLVVGLVPLIRANPGRLHEALKSGGRGTSLRTSRLGRSLVITEVALALVLVAGAGLLLNSMWKLQEVDLGLADIDQMMTFQVALPEAKYQEDDDVVRFFDALALDLEGLPGVEEAAFVNRLPILGGYNTHLAVWGDPERTVNFVSYRPVTSGYFDALGVPLVAGRWLEPSDFADGAPKVLINETLARQLFAGEDPIGQRISDRVDGGLLVVGVVGDVRGGGPTRPTPPAFYFPFSLFGGTREAAAIIRTAGVPSSLIPNIRQAVARLDPQLPVYRIRTLREVARDRLGSRRFAMSLFGVFAGLALLLGAVGIYGVMSFSVAQRSSELGVRLALGAGRGSVLRLVLGEGARLVAPGIAIGLILALAAARLLGSLLFQVSALDPLTYAAVALVLSAVALGATYVPALRATRVDPLASIRNE